MYSVLKFPETEDPPEIVPTFWVDELRMKTKWPPYDQPEKILKAIRKCVMPEDDWPEYTYILLVCKCDNIPCTKTKDETHLNNANVQENNSVPLLELDTSPINFNSDKKTGLSDANEYFTKIQKYKNTDENNQPKSPSMLSITPYRRKRQANVTENSATTLVNNTSNISDEDEVIEASPTQRSVASKVRQFLELKRKIAKKRIDFGSCPSPKHTSMQVENFNLDDTENKPPKKKKLLNKFNVWSKRKDISEQLKIRCKADRAKLSGRDCWECREYYNKLGLSEEQLQKRKNQISRHRHKYKRPNTPPGFWDPGVS